MKSIPAGLINLGEGAEPIPDSPLPEYARFSMPELRQNPESPAQVAVLVKGEATPEPRNHSVDHEAEINYRRLEGIYKDEEKDNKSLRKRHKILTAELDELRGRRPISSVSVTPQERENPNEPNQRVKNIEKNVEVLWGLIQFLQKENRDLEATNNGLEEKIEKAKPVVAPLPPRVVPAAVPVQVPAVVKHVPGPEKKGIGALLLFVVQNKESKAKELIRGNQQLLTEKGSVSDKGSGRDFDKVTPFQLALWARDKPMWEMIQKDLSREEQTRQLQILEDKGFIDHGKFFDLKPFLNTLGTYLSNWQVGMSKKAWSDVVKQKSLLPACYLEFFEDKFSGLPIQHTLDVRIKIVTLMRDWDHFKNLWQVRQKAFEELKSSLLVPALAPMPVQAVLSVGIYSQRKQPVSNHHKPALAPISAPVQAALRRVGILHNNRRKQGGGRHHYSGQRGCNPH